LPRFGLPRLARRLTTGSRSVLRMLQAQAAARALASSNSAAPWVTGVERQVFFLWRLSGYAADQRYQQPTDDTYGRWYRSTCRLRPPTPPAQTPTRGFCNLSRLPRNGERRWTSLADPTTGDLLTGPGRTPFAGNLYSHRQDFRPSPPPRAGGVCLRRRAAASPVTLWAPVQDLTTRAARDVRIDYNAPREFRVFGRFSLDSLQPCPPRELSSLRGVGSRRPED